MLEAQIVKTSL